MARLLEQFVESPRRCAYLPDAWAQLHVRMLVDVTPGELERLLETGWRRFGPFYFRPVCERCSECVPLRVVTATFAPNQSQRRAKRAAARMRRVVGPPSTDSSRLELYAKWHKGREAARGWEPNELDSERYALDFAFPHPSVREVAYYDDERGGRLVGLGILDGTPRAESAVFFFYDPDYRALSLGTAHIVRTIEEARREGKDHLYLGYWVEGCPSLRYKASFRPHELLLGGAENGPPRWTASDSETGTLRANVSHCPKP